MKRKNILGIISGFIFGFIASLPWLLVYIYGNYLLSLLTFIIPFGVYYGYLAFNKEPKNNLKLIIAIISIIITILLTMIIMPLVTLYNSNYDVSLFNLRILYESGSYKVAITENIIISMVFLCLGFGGVLAKINPKKIKNK
ncbi:MAG: hypothetical protein RSE91_02960 [Bacilli bacterium]